MVILDIRTGITGQIGGKGQAHVGAQVGNVGAQANLRVNIGIGNKNGHLGVNAGIHGGLDIKTGNGRNIHIGKQAIKNGIKNGARMIKREVVNRGARFIGRGIKKFGNRINRKVGPRTFSRIAKRSRKR